MVLAGRLEVLPDVRKSTSAERRSSMSCRTSFRSSPRPTMMPDLVNRVGSSSYARCRSRIEWKFRGTKVNLH